MKKYTKKEPESAWEIEIAAKTLREYARESSLLVGIVIILELIMAWSGTPRTISYSLYIVALLAFPFFVQHRTQWTLRQHMVLGALSGVAFGLAEGLLRVFEVGDFASYFQLIIQPVLLAVVGALLAGFLFIFVFPIIKKLKKYGSTLMKNKEHAKRSEKN